jgi:GntR family transcriptional regulator/MocR family aminotransferase
VIYVGSFSKTLFPGLRLGFVIVPPDLQDRLVAARAAADQHPPALDQQVLADFIVEGHFARHLRRMRARYRERLEAVNAAAQRFCEGVLRLRPVQTGLHVVAELEDADAAAVAREAAVRGVEVTPLSAYYARPGRAANALVLGFAAARPEAASRAMERVAAAIQAARRV